MGKEHTDLKKRTRDFIRRNRLVLPGEKVLVALSGGEDSVCLLDIMLRLEKELEIEVFAFHMNHNIRKTAARDAEFAAGLCEKRGVRLFCQSVDVPALSVKLKTGLEQAGRTARYGAMKRICEQDGIDRILTAHHMDDNAESVLLNIVRGSGMKGLEGISAQTGIISRPLIEASKTDIRKYCLERGLEHVEDETNSDISYARNRIRHEVMPELVKVNERAAEHIGALSRLAGEYMDLMDTLVDEVAVETGEDSCSVDADKASRLHPAVRKHLVMKMAALMGGEKDISSKAVEKAADLLCSERTVFDVSLAGGLTAARRYGIFSVRRQTAQKAVFEAEVVPGESIQLGDHVLLVRQKRENENISFKYIDKNRINGKLYVRTRREGDRFRPFGMKGSKTVKKYMIDRKIPKEERDSIPLLMDGGGIVAVLGHDISDRVRTDGNTKEVFVLEYKRK